MAKEENKAVSAQAKGNAVKRTNEKLGFFARVKKWFRDMKSELKKVVWPSAKSLRNNVLVSVGMMLVSAVAIWVFDGVASMLVNGIFTFLG